MVDVHASSDVACQEPAPLLSALLVTQDRVERLQTVLHHLSAQTIRDQIELVFAVPSLEKAGIDVKAYGEFAAVRVAEYPAMKTREELYAAAAFVAYAPLVVLVEDHCFPEPEWAENLVASHQNSAHYAVVGPAIINANPASAISWVHLIIGFGRWIAPVTSGEAVRVAAHNSCYRRDVLLAYSQAELARLLRFELLLHDQLHSGGACLFVASNCRVHHVNMSKASSLLISQINISRNFGALRASQWSLAKRLVYIFGTPLIPLLLFRHMRPTVPRVVPPSLRLSVYLWLFLAVCAMGLGELLGYTLGEGMTRTLMLDYEMERFRYVTDHDLTWIQERYGS